MTGVAAVLFDLDDTLCTYRRSTADLLPAAFERAGVEPFFAVAAYHERIGEYVDDTDSKAELRRAAFADLAEEAGLDRAVGERVAAAYADERDHAAVRALSGVPEVLSTLSADHRLALVTNGTPEMQNPKLDALDLRGRFETVVYAGHDVPAKPAAAPFERALSALDVRADRAVYVGDDPETDVDGATAVGLRTVLVGDAAPAAREPTDRVDDVAALRDPPWA
jgi:HAD superfamily hydrolase (TIGR01549 family)